MLRNLNSLMLLLCNIDVMLLEIFVVIVDVGMFVVVVEWVGCMFFVVSM